MAPDCGLKYLPRAVAFGKMKAMVEGARLVRAEIRKSAGGPLVLVAGPCGEATWAPELPP